MAFKLRSGNKTNFKNMGSSPAKRMGIFVGEGEDRERSDGTIFKTKADLYEIDNKDLVNVNSINDLMEKLDEEIRDNI